MNCDLNLEAQEREKVRDRARDVGEGSVVATLLLS